MEGMSAQQKTALALVGSLLGITLIGFSFLGGYAVRMVTHKTTVTAASQAAASPDATPQAGNPNFGVLSEIYDALQKNYVDPNTVADAGKLRQGSIDGLLNAVGDTHQVYIPAADIDLQASDLSGQFEGVGATVQQKNGQVSIEAFIPDYPASKSNLQIGDIITSVDGQSTQGKTSTDVVKLIRGRAGTDVKIGVKHNDGKEEVVTITRAQIKIDSVHTEQIKDANGNPVPDIAYLRISQFQQSTDQEVATYLKSIQGKPYKGLILDLRNNPGGLLTQTENILSDFLKPNQVELVTKYRGGQEQTEKAKSGSAHTDLPIVVLVNKNSASASEITAGALRDNGRATVMGEQTFGKGTVNQFVPLPKDGGELYVTIGRWFTPKGDQIEGTGITPDVVVHLGDNDPVQGYDNQQLYQAIDKLHQGG